VWKTYFVYHRKNNRIWFRNNMRISDFGSKRISKETSFPIWLVTTELLLSFTLQAFYKLMAK